MASGPLAAKEIKKRLEGAVTVRLEADKDRARAARFQPGTMPTLVFLSPRGTILDRTEGFVSEEDLGKKLDSLAEKAKAADEELAKLEAARRENKDGSLEELLSFWEKHQNWTEAVPLLKELLQKKDLPPAKRVQRSFELVRGEIVVLDFDAAVATAEEIVKDCTSRGETEPAQKAGILIGFCREQEKRPDDAIAAYEKAIAISPGSPLAKRAEAARDRLKNR